MQSKVKLLCLFVFYLTVCLLNFRASISHIAAYDDDGKNSRPNNNSINDGFKIDINKKAFQILREKKTYKKPSFNFSNPSKLDFSALVKELGLAKVFNLRFVSNDFDHQFRTAQPKRPPWCTEHKRLVGRCLTRKTVSCTIKCPRRRPVRLLV